MLDLKGDKNEIYKNLGSVRLGNVSTLNWENNALNAGEIMFTALWDKELLTI